MDLQFWLGLLAAFPIGIAVNFASRPILNWFDRWSGAAPIRKSAQLAKRIRRAERVIENPYATAATAGILLLSVLLALVGAMTFLILMHGEPGANTESLFPWTSVPPERQAAVIRQSIFYVSMLVFLTVSALSFIRLMGSIRDADRLPKLREALSPAESS
jgi:hypothetical protein